MMMESTSTKLSVKKRKRVAIVVALLAVLTFAAICSAEEDYFPLAVGSTWVYQTNFGPDITARITGTERVSDVECFVLEQVMRDLPNSPAIRYYYAKKDDKVALYKNKAPQESYMVEFVFESALVILQYPLSIGKAWSSEVKQKWTAIGQQGEYDSGVYKMSKNSKVLGQETITVPVGTFKCYKVESIEKVDEGSEQVIKWYAAGVGVVQEVALQSSESPQTIMVLKEYKLK